MSASESPFQITAKVLEYSVRIAELIGSWKGASQPKPKIRLRKENRIRTIQSTLAIEGNTLTLEQVTDIMNHKRVLGPKKEILEVQNAILAYESMKQLNPESEKDFLKLHRLLMKGLIDQAGRYREKQVGVIKGDKVSHVAPPAKQVPLLMSNLFEWSKKSDHNALVVSSIVHYEIEFIHPFSDGNGRMGRLWQSLILQKAYPIFEFVPIEAIIKNNQKQYYSAIEKSDQGGDSTPFLTFMMKSIWEALEETVQPGHFEGAGAEGRLDLAREFFGTREFGRKEYLKHVGRISTATASRDLAEGMENGSLRSSGEKRTATYRFQKK